MTHQPERQGPSRKTWKVYPGETYTCDDAERWPNGAAAGRRDKFHRRVLRKVLKQRQSAIDVGIARARQARAEWRRLAENNHEAKRYIAKDRTMRLWWKRWDLAWKLIGQFYRIDCEGGKR